MIKDLKCREEKNLLKVIQPRLSLAELMHQAKASYLQVLSVTTMLHTCSH